MGMPMGESPSSDATGGSLIPWSAARDIHSAWILVAGEAVGAGAPCPNVVPVKPTRAQGGEMTAPIYRHEEN
jgi:hypothetical protein